MQNRVIQGAFPHGLNHLAATAQRMGTPTPVIGRALPLPQALSTFPVHGGQPLPPAVRQKMESVFGTTFTDVRIHVGPQPAALGAHALTQGSDIHFAPGRYNPTSPQGQHALAHELAHVVQQRAGRVRNPFATGTAVINDPALEAEAEQFGRRAASHATAPVQQPKPAQAKLAPPRVPQPRAHVPQAVQPFARAPYSQPVQPFGFLEGALLVGGAVAIYGGYKYLRGRLQQREEQRREAARVQSSWEERNRFYEHEYEQPVLERYHDEHGWTPYDRKTDPHELREADIRPFGLETAVASFVLRPLVRSVTGKYGAGQVAISRITMSRDRMYTGHQEKTTPQGNHLFSYEALMNGIESFQGSLANLIGLLGTHMGQYQRLPNQGRPALTLLKGAVETLANMLQANLSLDAWEPVIENLLKSYVQIQQYSRHATSGHGHGAKSEGTHIEAVRKIEHRLSNGHITPDQAADAAQDHLEALFDLHGNQRLEYRQQSVREGTDWLRRTWPNTVDAYLAKYQFL